MNVPRLDALARHLAGRRSRRAVWAALSLPLIGLADPDHPTEAKRRKPRKPCVPPSAALQAAVDGAAPGTTVRLCAGIFPGRLTLAKDLTIVGAGAGRTTVSGQQAGTVLTIAAGRNLTIRGLTVTGGLVNAESAAGGIDNTGTLTLGGCAIRGNSAILGGGVRNRPGARLLLDATVVAGNSGRDGGGIYNEGELDVRNGSTIGSRNPDDGNRGKAGAGLFNAPPGVATFAKGTKVTGNAIATGSGGQCPPCGGGGIYNRVPGGVSLATSGIVTGNTSDGASSNCRGPQAVANCQDDGAG